MIGFLWRLILGGLWKPIAAMFGALALYVKGRVDQNARSKASAMKEDLKAHERINEADLGIGATDAERIDRLRGFAAKHGDRQAKGSGGGLR